MLQTRNVNTLKYLHMKYLGGPILQEFDMVLQFFI